GEEDEDEEGNGEESDTVEAQNTSDSASSVLDSTAHTYVRVKKRYPRQSPFDMWQERRVRYRVWPDDVDLNIHMNNGSYNKHLDFARVDWMASMSGLPFLRTHRASTAAVSTWFRTEIKPFQTFEIITSLLTYDPRKWFFLKHEFVVLSERERSVESNGEEGKGVGMRSGKRKEKRKVVVRTVHCVAISKMVWKKANGRTLPFEAYLERMGFVQPLDETDEVRIKREKKRMDGWKVAEHMLSAETAVFARL
ncbi:hypothetical protein HK102_000369, partial [Quaeritorhiza haematococci]